jgi:hypothetical protein
MFAWSRFLLKYPKQDEVKRKRSSLKRNHFSSFGLSGLSQTYRCIERWIRRSLPMIPTFSDDLGTVVSLAGGLASFKDEAVTRMFDWMPGLCLETMISIATNNG